MMKMPNGRIAYKIGLHIHTKRSDGRKSYEDVLAHYKANGYDAVAITDHWIWNDKSDFDGMHIISGAEYNIGGHDAGDGVYHILGLGCKNDPKCEKEDNAQDLIDKIHSENGFAVLAHPAWSLNSPDDILKLNGIDMTEIYNAVSDVNQSSRPYSGNIIDMLATKGMILPIDAADDSHYYQGEDDCVAYVWAYAEENTTEALLASLRKRDFFSTTGPYIDVVRDKNGDIVISTSSARKIAVYSNLVWVEDHIDRGEGLTQKIYTPKEDESFVRVEVEDEKGGVAWSNIIKL